MNDDLIKKVHDINYDVLRIFDEICKANDIPYFLDSGTLLGAVRHQDFIPWDDDLDVAVFAQDFPRLKAVLQDQLPPKYEYVEYTSHNGYFGNFINRVSVKGCQVKELEPNNPYSKLETLGMDILILESAPDNAFMRSLKIVTRKLHYIFALGHFWKLKYKCKTIFRNILLFILAIIGWWIPLKLIFYFHEYFINYKPINEKGYILGVNRTFAFLSCTLRKEWYKQSINVQIRDLVLPAPIGYDSVLKTMYGDYMQLPPEEDRVPKFIQEGIRLPE